MGGKFNNRGKPKTPTERLDRSHRRLEERLAELCLSAGAIRRADEVDEHRPVVADVLDYLSNLNWSGNIRQLENTCRWFSVMASGAKIQMRDLPEELTRESQNGVSADDIELSGDWLEMLRNWARRELASGQQDVLTRATPEFERALLECALESTGGRKQEAARLLGWGRNTLTRKLKELY
jgi:two-component system nitrogen regulation response regulator GlnG